MTCPHPDALRAAVTDLRCPLCMEAEIERLRAALTEVHKRCTQLRAEAADNIEWLQSTLVGLLTLAEANPSPLTNEQVACICRFALDKRSLEWDRGIDVASADEQQAASRWCIHSNPTLCKFPDCECERRS